MRDSRSIVLGVFFGACVFGVPITQAALDLRGGTAPQALELFELTPPQTARGWLDKAVGYAASAMDAERLRRYEDALEANSVFKDLGREGFQLLTVLTTGALGEKALSWVPGWYFYTPDVRYLAEPYFRSRRSASFGREDPVGAIARFSAQLSERGIALLVVPMPGKPSIYPDKLVSSRQPVPEVYANTSAFRRELEARGVLTLDMHRVLAEARAARPERELYMRSDTHLTGEGVRVAAEAIAKVLEDRGWAPGVAAEPARYRREGVDVRRRGDVIEMTKIPGREELFAAETVRVLQVHDLVTGGVYADDPGASILWLGDSFSRVFQTDEPGAAGIIANLAYELQAPLASIVNDGGASTLVRQQLQRRPELLDGKRVVVWEFVERDIRFGRNGWADVALAPPDTAPAPP